MHGSFLRKTQHQHVLGCILRQIEYCPLAAEAKPDFETSQKGEYVMRFASA